MARGVVVEPRDDRLWFAHALVADSVLHQLLGRERRRLHERCFDALCRARRPTITRRSPGTRSAPGVTTRSSTIARRGARQYLDRGASFQALRLACEGLAEDGDQLELLAVATEAAWRLDFQTEALDHARRWLELRDGRARPHRRPAVRGPPAARDRRSGRGRSSSSSNSPPTPPATSTTG